MPRRLRFTGDVWAIPEGTGLRERADPPGARAHRGSQIVETALLAIIGYQTSVASKAARMVTAARGAGSSSSVRGERGLASAFDAARAAYIAGCAGTSFADAGRQLEIPVFGTMAHSWVQAFPNELDAFREFSRTFSQSATYLLDTYDTISAARRLAASGLRPPVVRLDSGDLATLSRAVRRILNEAGLTETQIFATGDLDEHRIDQIVASGAPVDGFGVGTALTTVDDAPAMSTVYKLVEIERSGERVRVVKLSSGKETWPGANASVAHDAPRMDQA